MNYVCIEPTKFIDQRSGHTNLGFRIFDGYGQAYSNTWDSIPDDDLEVLRRVIDESCDTMVAMFDFMQETGGCLYIGENRYEWDQISHLWENNCGKENNSHIGDR